MRMNWIDVVSAGPGSSDYLTARALEALKAADAGWNVIIALTSAITALAKQTEDRIMRDFRKSGTQTRNQHRHRWRYELYFHQQG